MKAVSIIGYKKSGKSTLVRKLADSFEARGKKVAIAKYTHSGLDLPNTDTGSFLKEDRIVFGLSNTAAMVSFGTKKMLPDLLPLTDADILLVEGGKSAGWLPRVILLREPQEQEKLDQGIAIAAYGDLKAKNIPAFTNANYEDLVDLIEEKAFLLPALDCGACGEEDCKTIARKIVAGKATMKACKSINNAGMNIDINGSPVGLNPFVENIIRGSIEGMLKSLKGYSPGSEVTIKLK